MTHSVSQVPVIQEPAYEKNAIAQLKKGDIDGLALLVKIHQIEAVHVALLIIRDRGLAEEIVQEAFLQAYRKINHFDDRRPFRPWFLRIVINAALKSAQKQMRFVVLEEPQDGHPAADWLVDPALGPEAMAETAETHEMIWQALGCLTPDQRKAVVLRYFLDKNEREMVRELGRPITTVKWWLYSARHRLRTMLSSKDGDEIERREACHE
jgi:RNA polymerase sigma-70 factor (ECF subfamily)